MKNPGAFWRSIYSLWQGQNKTTRQILEILILVAILSSGIGALLSGDWAGLLLNFGTEIGGAVVTFVLIEQIIGAGKKKGDLIAQLSSTINEEAKRAVEELQRHGWLRDGSLRGIELMGANLREVGLSGADLQNAALIGVTLQGANLTRARLQGAYLLEVEFDEHTILPDGSTWTPHTDMGRFIDPEHPDFWNPA